MMPQKRNNSPVRFDIEKIQGMLPHRYPFLLVDRVLSLEKGKSCVALKNVSYNEPYFQGHFPTIKVMPGVLITEALAQTGGILLYNTIPDPDTKFVMLSKLIDVKFRRPVVPGDQLRLEVKMIKLKNRFCQIHGEASVDGDMAVEGGVIASLLDIEGFHGER